MPDTPTGNQRMRELPAVDLVLGRAVAAGMDRLPRELLLAWIREILASARDAIRGAAGEGEPGGEAGAPVPEEREGWCAWALERLEARATERRRHFLRRVVNATGVILHTNLGRAPLAAEAQRMITEAAAGYSSLEMDLDSGERRSRLLPVSRLLPLVTGAEAGLAVHNNAAAVFLALNALASGKEVIVSRGHLVEIGGSFRLPEIMAASGARLVEVGSTNRTRLADYARAISPQTALILQVHPSNFRLIGFTEETPTAELASLARERGIALMHDVGSGALRQHKSLTPDEPRVQDVLEAGADLVSFSGDKLLGGPQAGILVGRAEWIEKLRRHPVARVVRLDKIALAALETTLEAYADPEALFARVPLLALLSRDEEELQERAGVLAERIRALGAGWEAEVVATLSEVGGGSLPGLTFPSRGVALARPDWKPNALARALRVGEPPVIGRVEKDRFLLDVRALLDGEDELILEAVRLLPRGRG